MKKAILAVILLMAVLSSKGRIAWYGEQEFEEPVAALKEEGYTVQYIDALDEETLSFYDVLVLCFAEPSPEERDTILAFVEEGGGLLRGRRRRSSHFLQHCNVSGGRRCALPVWH
ncbi:MAG: hypothetical protein AYK18_03995 [Theionarchaea archaeon DG-70]|nr:MAG: hypothetical protein AYK18_03995 [Theionarchaea archaeon DG-70]